MPKLPSPYRPEWCESADWTNDRSAQRTYRVVHVGPVARFNVASPLTAVYLPA